MYDITMAYEYGSILPLESLSIGNGIGRGDVGNRIGQIARIEIYLAHRQALSELQNPRSRQYVMPGCAPAEEIDVQARGDRKPNGPDCRQQHDIHRKI